MMDYYKVTYIVEPREPFSELLMDALGEIGFESFEDTDNGFAGYVPEQFFDEELLRNIELPLAEDYTPKMSYQCEKVKQENWNAQWESNFQPVLVGQDCYVRAPFHEPIEGIRYEIVIMPKMSFGTGHHETTYMMLEYGLEVPVQGLNILDMGCGTAVLAILAAMRGAAQLTAIDIDEWAYENSLENVKSNNCPFIKVYQGDASLLGNEVFGVIFANINRNILLADMHAYSKVCAKGGILLMSGFYTEDLPIIESCAREHGFEKCSHKSRNNWVAASFKKM